MNATSTVRGQKVCSTKRVTSAVRGGCAVQREGLLSVLERQKVCIIKMSHLLYEETKCAVSGGLHLEYVEKVCSERRECTV